MPDSYDTKMIRGDGSEEKQRFYINNGNGFTLKEASNLLDGRAVFGEFTNREGEQYIGWKQLDMTQKDDHQNYKYKTFHENYGFDLNKALAKYPIVELKDDGQKEALIRSLQKGNLQAVTMEKDSETVRRFIAANPEECMAFSVVDAIESL